MGLQGAEGFDVLTADPESALVGEKWILYTPASEGVNESVVLCFKGDTQIFRVSLM
jgi:hypothetical protein